MAVTPSKHWRRDASPFFTRKIPDGKGFYINVAAVSIGLFGNQAWALRLPAVIFGILTVWGLYLLVAELATVEVALMTAFLLATSFWHINFSRMALRAIAAPCFLTWSLYLLRIGRKRASAGRRSVRIALMAGACYGLGFYTYVAYRATPLLMRPLLITVCLKRVRWKGWLGFAGAACLVTIPLAIYFLGHPGTFLGRTAQVSVLHRDHPAWEVVLNSWRTARMLFTRGDTNWRRPVPDWKALALG